MNPTLTDILNYSIAGNLVKNYLLAIAVFIAALIAFRIIKVWLINQLHKLSEKTKTGIDDLLIRSIQKLGWPFYVVLSLYIALQFINISTVIDKALYYASFVVVTYYAVMVAQNIIDYGTKAIVEEREKEEETVDTTTIDLLNKVLKGTLWVIAVVLILSNLGYNVSALITGLGIGGIAVAIALQNVLSDIFASFSIYFDRPFEIGDFIIVGNDIGTVKKIGIKTTRLESLWGQEIVISNRELTSTRINNYKKMEKRRVHFTFGITYGTPVEKVKKSVELVKEVFEEVDGADLDRVHFKEFGDSSLKFEVAYYIYTPDYNVYMDIQQSLNLKIMEKFEKEGIEFAYPTRTVFLQKEE